MFSATADLTSFPGTSHQADPGVSQRGQWEVERTFHEGDWAGSQRDGIACAVGDFDNDGKNDMAVALMIVYCSFAISAMDKFANVTKSADIADRQLARPA